MLIPAATDNHWQLSSTTTRCCCNRVYTLTRPAVAGGTCLGCG